MVEPREEDSGSKLPSRICYAETHCLGKKSASTARMSRTSSGGEPQKSLIKCPCCHSHDEEPRFTHFQVNLASDADRKVGFPFRALELLVCPDCGVVFERRDSPK